MPVDKSEAGDKGDLIETVFVLCYRYNNKRFRSESDENLDSKMLRSIVSKSATRSRRTIFLLSVWIKENRSG